MLGLYYEISDDEPLKLSGSSQPAFTSSNSRIKRPKL